MLYTQPHTQNRMLFGHKNKEMLPFAITQINLEGVMISEIHQRNTNQNHNEISPHTCQNGYHEK